MAIYMNMDRKLISKGGRTAYAMEIDQLKKLLGTSFQRFRDNQSLAFDDALYNALNDYAGAAPFQKVSEDIREIIVDLENVIYEGFVKGSNGVPALRVAIGGDWELPVRVFIYWDGKDFRGYIPVYGNAYNRFCDSALGSEEGMDVQPHTYTIQASKPGHPIWADVRSETETVPTDKPKDVVLDGSNYKKFNWQDVFICEAACLEDFSSRVVSKGPLPEEMFKNAEKAMCKLGHKPIDLKAWAELNLQWEELSFDCEEPLGEFEEEYKEDAVTTMKNYVEQILCGASAYVNEVSAMADYIIKCHSEGTPVDIVRLKGFVQMTEVYKKNIIGNIMFQENLCQKAINEEESKNEED